MSDTLQDLISRHLPDDWDDSPSRRQQISLVVSRFLSDTDPQDSVTDRRVSAQKAVADELDVTANTIQSKCGRETWEAHVESDAYQTEYFDSAVADIESEWKSLQAQQQSLFVMPIDGSAMPWFRRTIDTPYRFKDNAGLPDRLAGATQCRIWGVNNASGDGAGAAFHDLSSNDVVVFVYSGSVIAGGIVDETLESADVGEGIWGDEDARFIFTLKGYQRVALQEATLWTAVDHASDHSVSEFTAVSEARSNRLASSAGSVWNYLTRYYTPYSLDETVGTESSEQQTKGSTGDDLVDDEAVSTRAPYYWENQNSEEELEEGYLQAPRRDEPYYDLQKLEVGDIVFSYSDGQVIGYSTVTTPAYLVVDEEGEHRRVDVDVTKFAEPIDFVDFYPYLWREDVRLEKYYALNQAGVNMQYLHNMSEKGGEYLLEMGRASGSQHERLLERTEAPTLDIELPDQLHFEAGERARLTQQINAALNSGRHIIFTGPPGTGKSKLAKAVASQAAQTAAVDGYTFTTATAEWSTFDTVGGYVPTDDGNGLDFDTRLFLDCFRNEDNQITNQWLIIDELNRANIDRALGPLFSVLSEDSVTLPYERDEQIRIDWVDETTPVEERQSIAMSGDRFPITPAWRLLATMNTFDKASLYDLSFAFMRRFSFIHVGVPELQTKDGVTKRVHLDPDARNNYTAVWAGDNPELESVIEEWHEEAAIVWSIVNQYRTIGPAIVLDLFAHIEAFPGGDKTGPLTTAIVNLIFPQLEALREREQKELIQQLESGGKIAGPGDESPQQVSLRIDSPYLRRKARDMFGIDIDTHGA